MSDIHYQVTSFDKTEHPLFDEFLGIWESYKKGSILPSWSDLDFTAFPYKMISNLLLMDVTHDPLRLRYRFIGTAITTVENQDLTGQYVDQLEPQSSVRSLHESYQHIINSKKPFEYNMVSTMNNEKLNIANGVRVPMSNDGTIIHNVLTYIQLNADHHLIQEFYKNKI